MKVYLLSFCQHPSHLHSSELKPGPISVELRGFDESEMDAERSMDGGAVDAQENAVSAGGPRRVLRSTIETYFVGRQTAQTRENRRHV